MQSQYCKKMNHILSSARAVSYSQVFSRSFKLWCEFSVFIHRDRRNSPIDAHVSISNVHNQVEHNGPFNATHC